MWSPTLTLIEMFGSSESRSAGPKGLSESELAEIEKAVAPSLAELEAPRRRTARVIDLLGLWYRSA